MSNNLKIVVVDDSDFTRQATSKIISNSGHEVVAQFSSGEECLRYLHEDGSANLYIVDVVMPNMSGVELAKLITEKTLDGYIIMVSSLDTENIIIESISNGAIDFLKKPFSEDELIQSITKVAQNIAVKEF